MRESFVIVTELTPRHSDWQRAVAQVEGLARSLQPRLGLTPRLRLASLPADLARHQREGSDSSSGHDLASVLAEEAAAEGEVFVFPAMLDFGLLQKARLAEVVAGMRLEYHRAVIAYDDVVVDSRPLIQALSERLYQGLVVSSMSPERTGLLLLASGDGDGSARAQSHQLMRLIFDQLGFARGEVAFLHHARPLLEEQLERCAREALDWLIVPQMIWSSEPFDDARRRVDSFRASHSEAQGWKLMAPFGHGETPADRDLVAFNLSAWLEERIMVLWRSRRQKLEARRPSAIHGDSPRMSCLRGPATTLPLSELRGQAPDDLCYGDGCIAEVYDREGLAGLLATVLGAEPIDRVFIKVTWHGYAPGTYTDPVSLDKLLAALPAPAVLVEGHTSSRNLGGSSWDWRSESEQHRVWIAEQDAEYLRRTGIDEVIHKHKAQYLNVTEAFWDGQCAPRQQIEALLAEAGVELSFPELADFVPNVFLAHRGAPFLSFARFKGPQRASLTNLIGLIPTPLRTAWHGRTVGHFARVCCDIARIYRCLFRTYGMVEALNVAVKWNPKGLYRSRWGNYDLVPSPGIVTLSPSLATADVLASRLQGQPVEGNEFFRTVRDQVGFPEAAERLPIPQDLVERLV
jgi:hypothetical protein